MNPANYTYAELERLAYTQGDPAAALYARLADSESARDDIDEAQSHIDEAGTQYPAEDCLQDLIDHAHAMAQGRVTKAEVADFVSMLEERQGELARASEYGLDELRKAAKVLHRSTS